MAHKLELLMIHCTATPEGRHVYADDIRRWHTDPAPIGNNLFRYLGKDLTLKQLPEEVQAPNRRGRGWKQVGYADMIMLAGTLVNLVPYNDDDVVDPWEITNGASGVNLKTRHVVYVGGTDKAMKTKDTRTHAQLQTLSWYVKSFLQKYPTCKVAGHNQFAKKDCPSFDVPAWLESIKVSERNIYRG